MTRLFPKFNSESNQVDFIKDTLDDVGNLISSEVIHSMVALPDKWVNNRRKLTEFEVFNDALVWVSCEIDEILDNDSEFGQR